MTSVYKLFMGYGIYRFFIWGVYITMNEILFSNWCISNGNAALIDTFCVTSYVIFQIPRLKRFFWDVFDLFFAQFRE
ncbi:hypothetical protein DUD52_01735 [Listeria monocytogenes]|nr:hypothetical protein [Listeria monocytogenes]EAC8001221.1 hypothetical protein [Listeria monocytogenes]MBC6362279.1 hypothetical protein [Listeria monocytogenes]MCR58657.1 hypothetical protein [Listeria monocytogenes]